MLTQTTGVILSNGTYITANASDRYIIEKSMENGDILLKSSLDNGKLLVYPPGSKDGHWHLNALVKETEITCRLKDKRDIAEVSHK